MRKQSLFPRGKSGLKFYFGCLLSLSEESLPAREEWIEMVDWRLADISVKSLPAREEWIEIVPFEAIEEKPERLFPRGKSGLKSYAWKHRQQVQHCLFPRGKSGLKSYHLRQSKKSQNVSSREGRVD